MSYLLLDLRLMNCTERWRVVRIRMWRQARSSGHQAVGTIYELYHGQIVRAVVYALVISNSSQGPSGKFAAKNGDESSAV